MEVNMESLASNRPRAMTPRPQRTYRVEMGGRTVLVSLGLAVLTGLVIFYMGVLAGKSTRTAEAPEPVAESQGEAEPGAPGNLAFSDSLTTDKPVVEDLAQSQQQAARETADLLARAQRELTVEEVPATPPAAARAPAPAPAPAPQAPVAQSPQQVARPPAQAPANTAPAGKREPAATATSGELYTVQVFSSKSRESAAELVGRLKGLGFAAYLNQFQDSSRNTWYRVRVGRTDKTEAERLRDNLEQRANLKSAQVLPL
jgi:cell division septation protein DedD